MTKKDEQVIKSFAEYLKYNRKSGESTIKAYVIAVKQLLNFFNKDYSDITSQDIFKFIGELNKKYEPSSVNLKITGIQCFYDCLIKMKLTNENVARGVDRPAMRTKKIIPPTRIEMENNIKNLMTHEQNMLGVAVRIGAFMGLRIGEAIKLNVEDINFEKGYAVLYNTKTAEFDNVAIDDETLNMIKDYCKKNKITKGRVLRNKSMQPLTNSWMHKLVKEHCPTNYHMNRHFCGTEIGQSKGIYAVADHLRHGSIKTSMKYIHASTEQKRQTINDVFGK